MVKDRNDELESVGEVVPGVVVRPSGDRLVICEEGQPVPVEISLEEMRERKIVKLLISGLCVILLVCVGIYLINRLKYDARAASCTSNVAGLRAALRRYASHNDGLAPPISAVRGNLVMDPEGFFPEYLLDPKLVQCEMSRYHSDSGFAFNDDSFCYLPWEIRNEQEGFAFIEAYKTMNMADRDKDLVVTIDGKQTVLPRTRLVKPERRAGGAHRYVPIIIEWPGHAHTGAAVGYADGTVCLMELGEEFPMTEKFVDGLKKIASIDGPVPLR